jgi:hypothetical protein
LFSFVNVEHVQCFFRLFVCFAQFKAKSSRILPTLSPDAPLVICNISVTEQQVACGFFSYNRQLYGSPGTGALLPQRFPRAVPKNAPFGSGHSCRNVLPSVPENAPPQAGTLPQRFPALFPDNTPYALRPQRKRSVLTTHEKPGSRACRSASPPPFPSNTPPQAGTLPQRFARTISENTPYASTPTAKTLRADDARKAGQQSLRSVSPHRSRERAVRKRAFLPQRFHPLFPRTCRPKRAPRCSTFPAPFPSNTPPQAGTLPQRFARSVSG